MAKQSDSQYQFTRKGLKTQHKLERKRLARRLAGHNLSVINRARHGLAVKQRQERRALTSQRPRLGVKRQSFKSWLRERGRDY